jgi:hypothetical protein
MNGWQIARCKPDHRWNRRLRVAPARLGFLTLALLLACGCSDDAQNPAPASNASKGSSSTSADPAAAASAAPELPPPVEAYPPVPWNVPAGGLPDVPPLADVIDIGDPTGTGLGGDQYVYLFDGCRDRYLTPARFFERTETGERDFIPKLVYGQFDPATGKPVGQPVHLGPEFVGKYGFDMSPGRERADVSPSGVLAIQSVGTPEARIQMHVVPPQGPGPRVLADMPSSRWFGWTAANRLLILHEGKLQLWEGGAAPALEFGEKLDLPIVLAPARNWVVATVDKKYLEVYDTKTGEVLGRIGPEGKWKQLAVSRDGKQLAAVRHAGPMPDNSSSPPNDRYDIHTWDLTTGKPAAYLMGDRLSMGPTISWAGPNHVYYDQRVYDLDSRMAVVALALPSLGAGQDGMRGIHTSNVTIPIGSPDGRRWWTGNLGQAFSAPIPLTPPGGKPAFEKSTPVKLEVAGADAARNGQVKDAIEKALAAAGYTIGDSPWIARVATKIEETGIQLYNKQETFVPPAVRGELTLNAPDGATVATIPFGGEFSERHTAYLTKTTRNDPMQPMTTIYEFDFRGQDPRQAILQECWDKALKQLQSIRRLPTVWEVNGKFQSIPIPVTLQPPPGVPRSTGETIKPTS